jgi:hypothetical protein
MKKVKNNLLMALLALIIVSALAGYFVLSIGTQDNEKSTGADWENLKETHPTECEGVRYTIESVCFNPDKERINNMQTTLKVSINNEGVTMHGFMISVNAGSKASATKLFRKIPTGSEVIELPFGQSPESLNSVTLTPIINSNGNIVYCSSDSEKTAQATKVNNCVD